MRRACTHAAIRRGAARAAEPRAHVLTHAPWLGGVQTHVCFYMRTLGAGVRRTAYALHARGLRLCRLLLGYASVLMSCIGILYYKCILYSVFCRVQNRIQNTFVVQDTKSSRVPLRTRVPLYRILVLDIYLTSISRARGPRRTIDSTGFVHYPPDNPNCRDACTGTHNCSTVLCITGILLQ